MILRIAGRTEHIVTQTFATTNRAVNCVTPGIVVRLAERTSGRVKNTICSVGGLLPTTHPGESLSSETGDGTGSVALRVIRAVGNTASDPRSASMGEDKCGLAVGCVRCDKNRAGNKENVFIGDPVGSARRRKDLNKNQENCYTAR